MRFTWLVLVALLMQCLAIGSAPAGEPATGWRGNGTGLWPEATAPIEWSRIAHGAMEGMRAQANRPAEADKEKAPAVRKGLVAEWLILGPVAVQDSIKEFDKDLLGGEAIAEPTSGDQAAGKAWRRIIAPIDDPMVFGTAELPSVDLAKVSGGFRPNQIAYAHAYLFSQRGGRVRAVVEHGRGMKVWVNGHETYCAADRCSGLGYYTAISRWELEHVAPPSGRMEFDLKPGWNRLLVKLSSSNRDDFQEMKFCLRLMDVPTVSYETKNIRWMTELPGRSTSTPIIVRDRVFLAAEPDLLVCVDKNSGKLLWSAANNYYEALSSEDRNAKPEYNTKVAPLVMALEKETDRGRRLELRRQIQEALVAIDPQRYTLKTDGHFESHFGIVGFSMPTPVSDGRHVFVWSGLGVAACYDLDGHRQWITRVPMSELAYGSSPALADGVLAVYLGKLYGLDAKTGKLLWTQPRIQKNIAAVLAATFAGHQVFITQLGETIRPADGKLLFRPREAVTGDSGAWGPPVAIGDTMYAPKYGVLALSMYDFHHGKSDDWKPELTAKIEVDVPPEVHHRADGSWLDRATAGSPLVYQGLAYSVDIYGWLYVVDLVTKKTVYYKDLQLDGLMHYNAVPVAASATLVGENLVVLDNQGTALVLATGREFKVLARNRIETVLDRVWPIPAQETLAYAPPIADGDRIYLRGERYLYCIGAK
jgi:outer membrane protein assembly factor BamB